MKPSDIEKEIDRILQFTGTSDGHVVIRAKDKKIKAIRRFIKTNFVARPTEKGQDGSDR